MVKIFCSLLRPNGLMAQSYVMVPGALSSAANWPGLEAKYSE